MPYTKKATTAQKAKKTTYAKKKYPNNNNNNNSNYSYPNRFYYNYKKPYKYPGLGRSLGGIAGSAIGGLAGNVPLGNIVGQGIGQGAHALVKTITGVGDYTVSENSLIYNRDAVPQFSSDNPRCTVVSHSEFIRDIRGSTNFAVDSYNINPANANLFPWLSQIARNYEQVIFQGLVFQFKTTSATSIGSTNTALGTVIMATQYDTLAETFVNKQQMENYEFAQSCIPSHSIMHAIECDPSLTSNQGLFYIDNASNSQVNADPRLYNIGKFNIATVGMQAASTIGELWVTYKVCLIKPRMIGNNNVSDQYILDTASISDARPFSTNYQLSNSSSSYEYAPELTYQVAPSDQVFTALTASPWDGTINDATIFINPSFVGQLIIVYEIHGGPLPKREPSTLAIGNCAVVSTPALNVGFVTYSIEGSTPVVPNADGFHFVFVVQVNGGFNALGLGPAIQFSGSSINVPTFANLAIFAVANNLRSPY